LAGAGGHDDRLAVLGLRTAPGGGRPDRRGGRQAGGAFSRALFHLDPDGADGDSRSRHHRLLGDRPFRSRATKAASAGTSTNARGKTAMKLIHSLYGCAALVVMIVLANPVSLSAQITPDQQADMLLNSARKGYNEKNFAFAQTKFRDFLAKFGNHKDAPAAR